MASGMISGPGFELFPLDIATGGHVQEGGLLYAQAAPTTPDVRCTQDELFETLYGVDLRFRGDFLVASDYDLQATQGSEAVKANLMRSLVTVPGELFWRPTYGVGIQRFLNLPASAANIEEMKERIRRTLETQRAVDEVGRIDVRMDGVGLIELEIHIRISGQPERLSLGVRRA